MKRWKGSKGNPWGGPCRGLHDGNKRQSQMGTPPQNSSDMPCSHCKKAFLGVGAGCMGNERQLEPPCSNRSNGRQRGVVMGLEGPEAEQGKPMRVWPGGTQGGGGWLPPSASPLSFIPNSSATCNNVRCVARARGGRSVCWEAPLGCWTVTSTLVMHARLFQSNELQPPVQLKFGCLFAHS